MDNKRRQNLRNAMQSYRVSKENIYLYSIVDFMALSEFEQETCFRKMYSIYLTSVRGASYEEFKANLINRKGKFKMCSFIIDKQYNTEVGFSFYSFDELYLNEDDNSKENFYLCKFGIGTIMPNYYGGGITKAVVTEIRKYLTITSPYINHIAFHRVASPLVYDMLCSTCSLIYPNPDEKFIPILDKLLRKAMKSQNQEGESMENPFIIKRSLRFIGDDKEIYMKKYDISSRAFKYFIDKTGIEASLLCVTVNKLVEGNTLELPAQIYFENYETEYEYRRYSPLLNNLSKL